jgi:transposase
MDVISDSSSLTPRRMEIITGVERRRRWTAEVKAAIVAETFAPGATVAEVARRHDVRASQIHLWRKQAREARAPAFAPVVVSAAAPSGPAAAVLEIEAGAIRICVHAGAQPALVEAVVRALQEPPRLRSSARP